MSVMLDDILKRTFLNLDLDDAFVPGAPQPKVHAPRLGRSSSFLSPLGASPGTDDPWAADPWSSKPPAPFPRADRSVSLSESSHVAPPPGFPPLAGPAALPSARYKTELCRTFQESGACKYGAKCQFAHGEAELRGLNRHPKYKTEACRTFYNFGYCPYGARCHFVHEEKLTPLTARFQQGPASSSAPGRRQPFRQSVSFAGFMASRGSPSPPGFPEGFARAPSVSPPPAELLSPVFGDGHAFSFGPQQHQRPTEIHGAAPRCACGKPPAGRAGLQRFSSSDSLSDPDSYSSSGTQSPDIEGGAGGARRLTVFARLSVSD